MGLTTPPCGVPRSRGSLDTFPRLKRRFEPPLDVEQDPRLFDVAANRLHQEGMIDLIEGNRHTLPTVGTCRSE